LINYKKATQLQRRLKHDVRASLTLRHRLWGNCSVPYRSAIIVD